MHTREDYELLKDLIRTKNKEIAQLIQENAELKGVKGKTICVVRSIKPIHKTDTSRI